MSVAGAGAMGDSPEVNASAALDAELGSLRRTFYDEADERLLELEALLLEFDGFSFDPERMNTVFRAVHSIKGGSAACELANVVRFAHTFESLLDALRKERMAMTVEVVDVMLLSTDVLAALVEGSRNGDEQSDRGASEAVERIRSVLEDATAILPADAPEQGLADAGFVLFEDEVAHPQTVPMQARSSLRVPPLRASLRAASRRVQSLRAPSVPASPASELVPASVEVHGGRREAPLEGEDADAAAHAVVSEADLARMVTLAIDLQLSSARFAEQLSERSALAAVELAETARQIELEVGELESLLTLARGGDSATLLECIVIRLGSALYAVPLTAVHRYFTPNESDLRCIPTLGTVLMTETEVLPVVEPHFSSSLGSRAEQPLPATSPSETGSRQRVAISLALANRPSVLLVDEVLVQVKLLVRGLEANYQRVPGILGAAPYGSRVVLVLDLETLSRGPRAI